MNRLNLVACLHRKVIARVIDETTAAAICIRGTDSPSASEWRTDCLAINCGTHLGVRGSSFCRL